MTRDPRVFFWSADRDLVPLGPRAWTAILVEASECGARLSGWWSKAAEWGSRTATTRSSVAGSTPPTPRRPAAGAQPLLGSRCALSARTPPLAAGPGRLREQLLPRRGGRHGRGAAGRGDRRSRPRFREDGGWRSASGRLPGPCARRSAVGGAAAAGWASAEPERAQPGAPPRPGRGRKRGVPRRRHAQPRRDAQALQVSRATDVSAPIRAARAPPPSPAPSTPRSPAPPRTAWPPSTRAKPTVARCSRRRRILHENNIIATCVPFAHHHLIAANLVATFKQSFGTCAAPLQPPTSHGGGGAAPAP